MATTERLRVRKTQFILYILACTDGTLYTGITTDVSRRVAEHNSTPRGAKYTRSRRPVALVYSKAFKNRSAASKAEYRIRHLSHAKKRALIRLPRS